MAKNIEIDVDNVRNVQIDRITSNELQLGYGYVVTATYDLRNITDNAHLASPQVILQLDKQNEVQSIDNLLARLLDKARKEKIESTGVKQK